MKSISPWGVNRRFTVVFGVGIAFLLFKCTQLKICLIILLFVAFFCQGTCIIVAGYTTNWLVAVVCLTFAVGGGGFAFSGFFVNHLDIAPPFAGILMGISNAVATLPGIISPLLTGVIVQHQVYDRYWSL